MRRLQIPIDIPKRLGFNRDMEKTFTRVKVEALRVDTKIVHYGRPALATKHEMLYRIACQGRNARFLVSASPDQGQPVTCQKCKGRG